jgi:hypothetical protein
MSAAISIELTDRRLHARPHSACFACGQDNPTGLKISFQRQQNGDAGPHGPQARRGKDFRELFMEEW